MENACGAGAGRKRQPERGRQADSRRKLDMRKKETTKELPNIRDFKNMDEEVKNIQKNCGRDGMTCCQMQNKVSRVTEFTRQNCCSVGKSKRTVARIINRQEWREK